MNRGVALGAVAVLALGGALLLFARSPSGSVDTHERATVGTEELKSREAAPMVRPKQGERANAPSTRDQDEDDVANEPGTPASENPEDAAGSADAEDPVPDVVADLEITVWPLGREGIQGAVREVIPGIQRCYEDALLEVPDLAGKLSVGFEVGDVDGMGKVRDAWIEDDQLRDGPMSDCVEDAMRALQFDPPEGGGTMSVTYPIVFRPE